MTDLFIDWLNTRGNIALLAAQCGVSHQAVRRWRDDGVPLDRIVDVSRITGLRPAQIRPDFDFDNLCRLNECAA